MDIIYYNTKISPQHINTMKLISKNYGHMFNEDLLKHISQDELQEMVAKLLLVWEDGWIINPRFLPVLKKVDENDVDAIE